MWNHFTLHILLFHKKKLSNDQQTIIFPQIVQRGPHQVRRLSYAFKSPNHHTTELWNWNLRCENKPLLSARREERKKVLIANGSELQCKLLPQQNSSRSYISYVLYLAKNKPAERAVLLWKHASIIVEAGFRETSDAFSTFVDVVVVCWDSWYNLVVVVVVVVSSPADIVNGRRDAS